MKLHNNTNERLQCELVKPFLLGIALLTRLLAASDPYAALWLYNGTWQITRRDNAKPDKLVNDCALVGRFFACQQTVNGAVGALLIFIPVPDRPGHYYTQTVLPEGRATGRGDLEIEGNRWTYRSTWDQGGRTIYYRTTNVFSGRNHIHFEQAESTDNKEWSVKNSGDEVHLAAGKRLDKLAP